MRLVLTLACGLLMFRSTGGWSAAVPSIRAISNDTIEPDWKVSVLQPARFNAKGNLLVAYSEAVRGVDVLRELADDGAIVWECLLRPAGALTQFVRTAGGMTLAAQHVRDRYVRIIRFNRYGEFRGGLRLSAGSEGEEPPRIETLQALAKGRVFASVRGYAFEATFRGKVKREWIHRSLHTAIALSNGSLLAVLTDPFRFVVYHENNDTLQTIPLDALCQIWTVDRAEELGPSHFRFYGCFCMPSSGESAERRTIEVLETDLAGTLSWTYGSPHALRVDKFGERECVTYTKQVLKAPDGRIIILDTYPGNCQIVELAGQEPGAQPLHPTGRQWLAISTIPDEGVLGLSACPLIGAQLLR